MPPRGVDIARIEGNPGRQCLCIGQFRGQRGAMAHCDGVPQQPLNAVYVTGELQRQRRTGQCSVHQPEPVRLRCKCVDRLRVDGGSSG
jgi:hypothetical protein